jgi:hypothetical protein
VTHAGPPPAAATAARRRAHVQQHISAIIDRLTDIETTELLGLIALLLQEAERRGAL